MCSLGLERIRCYCEDPTLIGATGIDLQLIDYNHAALTIESDSKLSDEQYILIIGSTQGKPVTIRSAGRRGSLHGLRTLEQLIRFFGRDIPAMIIEDEPAFPNRGVMLDVSRNRVPRMDELLRIINQLASWKINHLQLYTEHTFRYLGHEEVWRGSSAISTAQVERLDRECVSRGITLAANQNCFGHMERWLRHPRYASLAETHDDWKWEGRSFPGPFSLCPTDPGSIDLVEDILGQLLPHFRSGLVNIGCDETLDVGQGRSHKEVARRGGAAVYFDFVRKVTDLVHRSGFKPMFWADIALSHPEELHRIPPETISLAWGYEPDAPFGEWCRRLREAGSEVWVCPGTSSWRSITGRTFERQANVRAAVEQGLANGATGLLMTDWGDEGHRQQWPVSLIGLAEAANAAWTGSTDLPVSDALDMQVFGRSSSAVASWLRELGNADLSLRRIYGNPAPNGTPAPLRNSSALYLEMHREKPARPSVPDLVKLWEATLAQIRSLSNDSPAIDDRTNEELRLTVEIAELAALIALYRINRTDGTISRKEICSRLDGVIAVHRRLWRQRSRSGGLGESIGYYRRVQRNIKRGVW